jgi:hypothetical protein
MKRHFNIHVYKTYDEFSILFKLDESKIIEDYDDEDVINLAIDLGELNEEDFSYGRETAYLWLNNFLN